MLLKDLQVTTPNIWVYWWLILDFLIIISDREWDCPRRLLCEANQRAVDYGATHGVLMYLASLFVSFWLRDLRVSSSIEAMKRGRHGDNCTLPYPCPFSLWIITGTAFGQTRQNLEPVLEHHLRELFCIIQGQNSWLHFIKLVIFKINYNSLLQIAFYVMP